MLKDVDMKQYLYQSFVFLCCPYLARRWAWFLFHQCQPFFHIKLWKAMNFWLSFQKLFWNNLVNKIVVFTVILIMLLHCNSKTKILYWKLILLKKNLHSCILMSNLLNSCDQISKVLILLQIFSILFSVTEIWNATTANNNIRFIAIILCGQG